MKYLIYHSDYYYPYEEVFETLDEAESNFRNLQANRRREVKDERDCLFFEKDYLCIIIDEIDKEKLKSEIPLAVQEEE